MATSTFLRCHGLSGTVRISPAPPSSPAPYHDSQGPLPFLGLAPAGPRYFFPVGQFRRPFRHRALAKLTVMSATHWAESWVAPCQTRTGGQPASELPIET